MLRILLGGLVALLLSGCMGGSNSVNSLSIPSKKGKTAELEYTKIGTNSGFEFKGIMKGTYKDLSASGGVFVHTGKRSIDLTTKATKNWTINVRTKKKSYRPYGNIAISVNNPYVATIKQGKKRIGDIVLLVDSKVDKKSSVMSSIGMGGLINNNLKIKRSKANILGVGYTIKSIYKDKKGKVSSNPIAYKVLRGKTTYGIVAVGKNAFGGRTMSIWLRANQSKLQQQSVATILTVVGYSSLAL
jgi:hypothetical protein